MSTSGRRWYQAWPSLPIPQLGPSHRLLWHYLCGAALALGLYLLFYGALPLSTSYVDWIYNNSIGLDITVGQLGWEWYREAPWSFPLGSIPDYGYPFGTNITWLDANILFSVPAKVLSPLLGRPFQFWGIWELTCFIAMALVAIAALSQFTDSVPARLGGAAMLIMSPPFIQRVFRHVSLSAHWILVAGILLLLLEYRKSPWRWAWCALFSVAVLVNSYYVAMLVPLWATSYAIRIARNGWKQRFIPELVLPVLLVILLGFVTGLFSMEAGSLQGAGSRFFTWNLNGFINPIYPGSLLPPLPHGTAGQAEGLSYLGLGNILLLVFALYYLIRFDPLRSHLPRLLPVAVLCLGYAAYAGSPTLYAGSSLVYDVPLPTLIENARSIFRAAGRFIWPAFYIVVCFSLISIARNSRHAGWIFLVAAVIQFIDLKPLLADVKFSRRETYRSVLTSEFWEAAAAGNRHVVLIPASHEAAFYYQPYALYANGHGLTLNWGYFGRAPAAKMAAFAQEAWASVLNGLAQDDVLYVLWEPRGIVEQVPALPENLVVCQVDGVSVILAGDNPAVQSAVLQPGTCSRAGEYRYDMTYPAALLPSQTGSIQGTSRRADGSSPAGFLSYGPYVILPMGQYEASLTLEATGHDGQELGLWDVVVWSDGVPTSQIAGKLVNGQTSARTQFRVDVPRAIVEVRTYHNGTGDLLIKDISILAGGQPLATR